MLHLILHHGQKLSTLCFGNMYLLEYDKIRGDADNSFLVSHSFGFELVVDHRRHFGYIFNMTINNQTFAYVDSGSIGYLYFAVSLGTAYNADVSVCNIK